jgi:hypothetical protein
MEIKKMNPVIPSLTYESIRPWFNKHELINDCVLQVKKDLFSYGIELSYSGNYENAYTELLAQLEPQIKILLKQNSVLTAILYRVDVDEDLFTKALDKSLDISKTITQLILWRELQKVVTRFLLKK